MENIPAQQESFVQGPKSETVEKALSSMRELQAKYETIIDEKEKVNLNLYEFPKMIEAIWEVEVENLSRVEKGEREFRIEKTPEYEGMAAHGLTISHIDRQKELAQEKR